MTITQQIQHMATAEYWFFLGILSLFASGAFYMVFRFLRRARIIEDTPTAKIRSAHQGYVELDGTALMPDGEPLLSPLTDTECCWYRYEIEKKGDKNWRTLEKGSSDKPFILKDETGLCLVLPQGAEVTPSEQSIWYGHSRQPTDRNPPSQPVKMSVGGMNVKFHSDIGFSSGSLKLNFGKYRYTEERIYSGDAVYALGDFRSMTPSDHAKAHASIKREILNFWKKDQDTLTKRFDENGDGQIDPQEWEQARQKAHRITDERYEEEKEKQIIHSLEKPSNKGFPFLISSLPEFSLAKRYRTWSRVLLTLFFLFGSGAVFLLSSRF